MAKAKEFTVAIADKPGALGKCFLALAERGVNILAYQSYVEERESLVRFVADNLATAKAVLATNSMIFEETDVAVVRLEHRQGALGRAARCLGEAQINIDYSYCGFEPGSALALLVFGVDKLTKAATLLPTNLLRWIARRTRAILLSLQGTLAASADLLRCPDWDPRYLLTICCCTPNPALWTNPPALQ